MREGGGDTVEKSKARHGSYCVAHCFSKCISLFLTQETFFSPYLHP